MADRPIYPSASAILRYWSKVAVSGEDECWPRVSGGIRFSVVKGFSVEFRRVSWWIRHGHLPDWTRHVEVTCGNVLCVNPKHLSCPSTEERFWSHVDRSGECWNWTGALAKGLEKRKTHHYGAFCYRQHGKRVWIMVHRYSWELANGPIVGHVPGHPELEICVLHKCDNTLCVRPEHLFLGSDKDNIHDMIRKGRHPTSRVIPGEATP
jgi:hypothetical protein